MLKYIKYLFIEINFESIYENEAKSSQILDFLCNQKFRQILRYSKLIRKGKLISYDFLFEKILVKIKKRPY